MPAIITWSTGTWSGAVSSNKRDVATRVNGGPMPIWMAVTSEWPTRPVQGAPLASLVRRSPKAVTMACISRGMGARTTTWRLAELSGTALACPLGELSAQSSRCGSARSSARTAASQKPMKPSPSLAAMKSRNVFGSGDVAALRPPHMPGPLAALFEGHRPLVHGPCRSAQDEAPCPAKERIGRRPHLLDGAPGAGRVVDRALVLVHEASSPPPRAELWSMTGVPLPCRPTPSRKRGGCAPPRRCRSAACASPGAADPERYRPVTLAPGRRDRSAAPARVVSSAQVISHWVAQQGAVAQGDVMWPARWSL